MIRFKPLFVLAIILCNASAWGSSNAKFDHWRAIHHGVNMMPGNPAQDYAAAADYGVRVIRVGDFDDLVGEKGGWDFPEGKLRRIDDFLELCAQKKLKVIVTLHHIPGRFWAYRKNDTRIWEQAGYQESFFAAWKTLAQRLKAHPNVIAYDLINEPYLPDELDVDIRKLDYPALRERYRGTLRDVNLFYRKAVAAVRSEDKDTPIIIETTGRASIEAIQLLDPLDDPFIIYSFHYYEPFNYFSRKLNRKKFAYPGIIPDIETGEGILWDKSRHLKRLRPICDWQDKNKIEGYRIFVGEFGVWKDARGAVRYLEDVADALTAKGWSWSYYSFRENEWDHCDLELAGNRKTRAGTPLFDILRRRFR